MSFNESKNAKADIQMGQRRASNASLLAVVGVNLRKCRFCVSSTDLFLMAPPSTRIGDIFCVFFGLDMPVVLREKQQRHYIFIGECRADGIMDGEAIEGLAARKYMC
jgi:hypothetical protein